MQHLDITTRLQLMNGKKEIGKKGGIMKKNILVSIASLSLLMVGCTSETDTQNDSSKITKIYVGTSSDEGVQSRTATNGNSVTWVTNDQIALIENGDRGGYKQFQLSSDPGTNKGYFNGVGAGDYLTNGRSYKVVYPHSAATYTGAGGATRLDISGIAQGNNSNSNLATYDWLVSSSQTVTDGVTMPAFTLNHCFALLKITLNVSNIVEDDNYASFLKNLAITTKGNEKAFAEKVSLDGNVDLQVHSWVSSVTVARTDAPWLGNESYVYWFIIKPSDAVANVPLTIQANFSTDKAGLFQWTTSTEFTPTAALKSGKFYELDLSMVYNNTDKASSTLTVIGH